ncbi:MAG: hypothetical protein ABI041_10810, partial [Bdellovibrionia bacterium]
PSISPTQLVGQPFDFQLLTLSSLYRKSRRLYRSLGGRYSPSLLSSGRTLSSASLLTDFIEYSPIEQELIWNATDVLERKAPAQLLKLRTYCTSVFHEQNHRILWGLLPPPPKKASQLRMYLNFAESLVVAADMALGDELGYYHSRLFHLIGVIYHPGTNARQDLGNTRNYRNYLHAAIYATYLNLELFEPHEIEQAVRHLYPNIVPYADYVLDRCLRLDRKFVEKTNPFWQHKHGKKIKAKNADLPLQLPDDPLDNRLLYLWAEKWMDKLGIT